MSSSKVVFLLLPCLWLWGCTTDITVSLPEVEENLVVEGHIANGEPPYVLLTRSVSYFGGFDVNDIGSYFVHNAVVKVWNRSDTVTLTEICLTDLPPSVQQLFAGILGIPIREDSAYTLPDVCVYTLLDTSRMIGRPNRTYHLRVEAEGKVLTSKTHIPFVTPLDSAWYKLNVYTRDSSYVRVFVRINDPDTLGNYIRYFTKRNNEPFYPGLNSVFDDLFINGKTFSFPIDRGQPREEDIDPESYGFFWRGDTVTIRWSAIDRAHYEFWRTLEAEMNGGGPVAAPVIIKSNIEGGLGIWGGYANSYYTLIIPE